MSDDVHIIEGVRSGYIKCTRQPHNHVHLQVTATSLASNGRRRREAKPSFAHGDSCERPTEVVVKDQVTAALESTTLTVLT